MFFFRKKITHSDVGPYVVVALTLLAEVALNVFLSWNIAFLKANFARNHHHLVAVVSVA